MIAVDTNVLIYACDQADAKRQKVALDLITNAQDGVLLWQVGCEFISCHPQILRSDARSSTVMPPIAPSDIRDAVRPRSA